MYDIRTIAEKIGALKAVLHQPDDRIKYILTDSRSLIHPEHTLFFAFRTNTGDGHKYIEELYRNGVRNFVAAGDARLPENVLANANVLYVVDALKALQRLATAWRKEFSIPVVGITGSNGKTITKEFLYQMLSPKMHIVRSPRSYNSQLGVPLSVLKIQPEDEFAIFEAGISQPAEMDRLEKIIQPELGIFTNIGAAHQENFTDIDEKVDEKLLLFRHSRVIVYNENDETIQKGLKRAGLLEKAVGWRLPREEDSSETLTETPGTFLQVEGIAKNTPEINRTTLSYRIEGKLYHAIIPFIDDASIKDILHCLTLIAKVFPQQHEEILTFLEMLEPVKMRLEMKKGVRGNIVINDTYNNDVNSLSIALDFLRLRAEQVSLRKAVILSDILQSSLTPKSLYRNVAEMIKKYDCDLFVGIGREITRHADFFESPQVAFFPSTIDFLKSPLLEKISDSAVLVKGARQYRFEDIAERLAEQSHATTLEVNLASYVSNLNSYRALLPHKTKVMAMIKANAYGLGAYETALAMGEASVDYLAVAVADEGKELRKRGIYLPIVVMDPGMKEIETLIDFNLEPVVHSSHQFHELSNYVDREGFTGFPIHIEIDTGMHRLGFHPDEVETLARAIHGQRILEVKSVFTHLAVADDPNEDSYTHRQIALYKKSYQKLTNIIGYLPIRHVLNTAGCERFSEEAMDMVRLGIGLYGVSPTRRFFLEPVVRLRTTLMQASTVEPHGTIGYGRRGVMPQGGRVGIIPIGYADGYDRRFGNGVGKVIIRGRVYPTIGNICMDLTMIDLTSAPEGEPIEGDEVLLIGKEKAIDISELADAINTIPYEIIANLASRIQRIYYKE